MKIDRELVLICYMGWVKEMVDHCEHKTDFTPKEVVDKICEIIEGIYNEDNQN